jgi:hypothetical protein
MDHSAHIQQCVFYGVHPLDAEDFASLTSLGYTLEEAYSVACDILCGFSMDEALEALNS